MIGQNLNCAIKFSGLNHCCYSQDLCFEIFADYIISIQIFLPGHANLCLFSVLGAAFGRVPVSLLRSYSAQGIRSTLSSASCQMMAANTVKAAEILCKPTDGSPLQHYTDGALSPRHLCSRRRR